VVVVADASPFLILLTGGAELLPSLLLLLLELLLCLVLDPSLSALANPSAKAMLLRELADELVEFGLFWLLVRSPGLVSP
jgi:hypothetical protein